ncbi:hypothetical protein FJV41_48080 [Myxococcus llanfairpwllgwyngyllgogerychwyrndrobwllllantysiliogogogochensis]|uniref:Uncharacterized protein n=1 Tax=Myxococcus llanfairpwllgwyngyllgogerychwyrndrobwllllantysiliogogogochensis TaxID=2590453 RepID=A0A540WIE5_9BACT|nr:hypothetical protein FJV41_48080 [Myxococcus llanfairpwllgwyngyllgogerychwyrndrobwllllantysiliogogogochensis]
MPPARYSRVGAPPSHWRSSPSAWRTVRSGASRVPVPTASSPYTGSMKRPALARPSTPSQSESLNSSSGGSSPVLVGMQPASGTTCCSHRPSSRQRFCAASKS